MADNKYNVLYNLAYFNLAVGTAGFDSTDYNSINKAIANINIPKSDILSIAVINNYDTAMYPIIRIRLYTDLSNMISISEHPDEIYVNIGLHGIICDTTSTNDGNASIKQLKTTNGDLYGNYKAYLENKNIPTTTVRRPPAKSSKSEPDQPSCEMVSMASMKPKYFLLSREAKNLLSPR